MNLVVQAELDKLCIPQLDNIYCVMGEHRLLMDDLFNNRFCYLNRDMMGFRYIESSLDKRIYSVEDISIELVDDVHKNLILMMNPKLGNHGWVFVKVRDDVDIIKN